MPVSPSSFSFTQRDDSKAVQALVGTIRFREYTGAIYSIVSGDRFVVHDSAVADVVSDRYCTLRSSFAGRYAQYFSFHSWDFFGVLKHCGSSTPSA